MHSRQRETTHEICCLAAELVQNKFFLCFGPSKSLFSFSTAKTEKNSWKKLGKTKLVVWCFDVTNKIVHSKILELKYFVIKNTVLDHGSYGKSRLCSIQQLLE
jgi:hypothetical protein